MIEIGPDHQLSVSMTPATAVSDPVYGVAYQRMPEPRAGAIVQGTGILDIITTYVVPAPTGDRVLWHDLLSLQVDNVDAASHDIYITLVGSTAFELANILVVTLATEQRLSYTPSQGFRIQRNDTA